MRLSYHNYREASSGATTPVIASRCQCSRVAFICFRLPARLKSKPSPLCELRPEEKPVNAEWARSRQGFPALPISAITLHELLQKARVYPILVNGDTNIPITGIQHDSRLVQPGDLFVCCKGFCTDGHVHAAHAAERGAIAFIGSRPTPTSQTFVQVEDTNSVLSALSAVYYGNPSKDLTVVGITGTNGKTTTSYLVKSVFEAMDLKTGLLGTIAYNINDGKNIIASNTTPDALALQQLMAAMVSNNARVCVMEVSSHALALGRCNAVEFNVAVFTNLTHDHLDFHVTEQNYKESKGLLFAKMVNPCEHTKVVNMDDPHASYFAEQGSISVPVVRFSLNNRDADVFASNVELSLFKTEIVAHTSQGDLHITSKLLGRHNVSNILAAVAVGIAANTPLDVIVAGVQAVHAVPGRCQLIEEGQNFAVLVDYAHTPDALARLLDTVRECGAQRIITVIGCGGDRDRGKRPIMAKLAAERSDLCILTSDNPRTENPLFILDEMLGGLRLTMMDYLKQATNKGHHALDSGVKLIVCEKRQQAIKMAILMGQAGDAVVVAGKGHEDYQIVGSQKEHFDDREECRKALQNLQVAGASTV